MHEHWKVLDVIITTWYYKSEAKVWQGACGELDLTLNLSIAPWRA